MHCSSDISAAASRERRYHCQLRTSELENDFPGGPPWTVAPRETWFPTTSPPRKSLILWFHDSFEPAPKAKQAILQFLHAYFLVGDDSPRTEQAQQTIGFPST